MKKRFSMRNKLLLVFGLLTFVVGFILVLIGVRTARKAVTEKVEAHLIDKATDTAEIIDGRANTICQFLEGIARMPILTDPASSYADKIALLKAEEAFNPLIHNFTFCDIAGNAYVSASQMVSVQDREWFHSAIKGKTFITEPILSRADGSLSLTFAVPIYDNNRTVIGVLAADLFAQKLSEEISDIVVGKTGECYILGLTGTTIAQKNFELVRSQDNILNNAKTNSDFTSLATFTQHALEIDESEVGYYEYNGIRKIASYATMKTTGWTVIVQAPKEEFMGTVNELKLEMILIGFCVLAVSLIIVFFVARRMIKPVKVVVGALKDIAQGEGDLTVRLPVHGNDEVTDLSEYFNETIEKIGSSIKTVGENSEDMTNIGNELASNMTETASAVHQISANIDGVKQQALTQAASVTETAATVEEIIRTIKQLNGSIENQAASVAESSSAIEQMVSNIASITQTLDKTNDAVKTLANATADGKETVSGANNVTQGKTITETLKVLSAEIETLSASAKTAEEKFNIIFSLSDQVKTMSQNLMDAMREQENGSKEVLSAIRDINMVTNQVNDGSAEMLHGGENVAQEMQKLDELTRVITDSMNEMASGAVQISNAVQEVNAISQKNKHSIENLANEVSKFKV